MDSVSCSVRMIGKPCRPLIPLEHSARIARPIISSTIKSSNKIKQTLESRNAHFLFKHSRNAQVCKFLQRICYRQKNLNAYHPSSGCSCFYWQFTILLRNHTRKLKINTVHWPLSNSLKADKLEIPLAIVKFTCGKQTDEKSCFRTT